MKLGVQAKLFFISVFLVTVAIVISGLFLHSQLREKMETHIQQELRRHTNTAKEMIELVKPDQTIDAMDIIADSLGQGMQARVTIISNTGVVLGDSQLSHQRVQTIENHATRSEVVQATQQGHGQSRRFSTTLETDMLYLATLYSLDQLDPAGVVRVAMPLVDVDSALRNLRTMVTIAALFGVILAIIMSAVASYLMSLDLKKLVISARALAEGHSQPDLPEASTTELDGLAHSINRMSSELNHLMTSLATERDRFEAVLNCMDGAVLALDRDQRITHANQAAIRLFGLPAEPVNQGLLDVIRVPKLYELAATAAKNERANSDEFDLLGNPKRRIVARATPHKTTGGSVVVTYDVTDLRRLETIRRDFVANVSHELRTPASIILAHSETLSQHGLTDSKQATASIEALGRNAQRLSNLVDDLLDITTLEAGQQKISLSSVSLRRLVDNIIADLTRPIDTKNLSVVIDIDDQLQVTADAKALEQVVYNLLDNAINYSPEAGTISLMAEHRDEHVKLQIIDQGPGIPPKHRSRIFERFYRVDVGRSRAMGGTGLGLSIVKHLTEAMGGQVGVEPSKPKGSAFWLRLASGSTSTNQDQ